MGNISKFKILLTVKQIDLAMKLPFNDAILQIRKSTIQRIINCDESIHMPNEIFTNETVPLNRTRFRHVEEF